MRAVLLALLMLLGGCAGAGAPATYRWHDGEQERELQRVPGLVAQFDRAEAEWQAGAELVAEHGQVRIWRLAESAPVPPAASPVLSEGSTVRALPGGVIVRLDPRWDPETVRQWLERQGLTLARELPVGPNTLELASAPGLAALELSERLRGQEGVISSSPNWWQVREPRLK